MPTDRATLLALAERCEAATGPDRELDGDIWRTVNGWSEGDGAIMCGTWHRRDPDDTVAFEPPPESTASLDAAKTLVPEGWFWALVMRRCGAGFSACCVREGGLSWHDASTPALALCSARLRALAAQPHADGGGE